MAIAAVADRAIACSSVSEILLRPTRFSSSSSGDDASRSASVGSSTWGVMINALTLERPGKGRSMGEQLHLCIKAGEQFSLLNGIEI